MLPVALTLIVARLPYTVALDTNKVVPDTVAPLITLPADDMNPVEKMLLAVRLPVRLILGMFNPPLPT